MCSFVTMSALKLVFVNMSVIFLVCHNQKYILQVCQNRNILGPCLANDKKSQPQPFLTFLTTYLLEVLWNINMLKWFRMISTLSHLLINECVV